MSLDEVDALSNDEMVSGCLASVAGLQVVEVGFDSEVVDVSLHVEDAFQFVALFDYDVLLGRNGKPVEFLWRHLGTVAFHCHLVAGFV